jgi:hypothetical protein
MGRKRRGVPGPAAYTAGSLCVARWADTTSIRTHSERANGVALQWGTLLRFRFRVSPDLVFADEGVMGKASLPGMLGVYWRR